MTIYEKTIITLYLTCAVTLNLFTGFSVRPEWLKLILSILIIILLIALIAIYISKTKATIYNLTLAILIISEIGALFKILHWPGAGLIMGVGLFTFILIPFLLLKTGIQLSKANKKEVFFNFAIAILILGQLIAILNKLIIPGQYFHYLILPTILLMKLKGIVLKIPENRILTIIALHSTLFVLSDITKKIINVW